MNMHKQYWVWLANKCGVASTEFLLLMEKFGDIEDIYNADYDDYSNAGISERLCEDLCDKDLDEAFKIVMHCEQRNNGILTYDSPQYPKALRLLKNPPVVLYYAGKLPDLNERLCISVVGTRNMSEYGMKAAYKIAFEVAASRAIVVSGMALGIDGIASCAALAANGTTVAVMGCGIDQVYPKEHKTLWEFIKNHGAVITEFPPATEPRGMNFPLRNRIISGLSQGTVVVDAALSSGAMITAKHAIMQGKDIYAVPANIDGDNSSGTNSLIRDGAQAVLCGKDIINNYSYIYRDSLDMVRLAKAEKLSDFNDIFVSNMGVCKRDFIPWSEREEKNKTREILKSRSEKIAASEEHKKSPESPVIKAEDATVKAKPEAAYQKAPDRARESVNESEREKSAGDNSLAILEKLNEKQRRVFDEMPLDRAVTVDYLAKLGIPFGEVISALTVLEIKGLITSLPGALYIRK